MDNIGNRMDLVRRNWGMTLEEFGQELGYGQVRTAARQVMSRMLKGHRQPTLENLRYLQQKGIDLNWLVSGIGEIQSSSKMTEKAKHELTRHFYDGPYFIETIISRRLNFHSVLNMQADEVYSVKVNTEMMSPTIKIEDVVNCVRVDRIIQDGLYVSINDIEGESTLWIKRFFMNPDQVSFRAESDHPNFTTFDVARDVMDKNKLNLRVFSSLLTLDRIFPLN